MNRSLTSLTEEPSSSFSSRDAEDSSIQRSYLSCGAKLVTRSIKNHPNFNFFIRVIGAGSGAETLGNFKRGLSHMHEHVSMSSSRWPLNGEGFYALRNRTGWPMGAGTSIESIDYSFQIPLKLWRPTVEFGSSIVCRPNSTQKQVEAEQRVVLGEWLDYEMDKPAFMMREKTRYHAYGQHPYYYVSLGTEDDILSITKSDPHIQLL